MRQFKYRAVTVPKNAHPLVQKLFREMIQQRVGLSDMADRSGVTREAITAWRTRQSPTLTNIEACFRVLGMELRCVHRGEGEGAGRPRKESLELEQV